MCSGFQVAAAGGAISVGVSAGPSVVKQIAPAGGCSVSSAASLDAPLPWMVIPEVSSRSRALVAACSAARMRWANADESSGWAGNRERIDWKLRHQEAQLSARVFA